MSVAITRREFLRYGAVTVTAGALASAALTRPSLDPAFVATTGPAAPVENVVPSICTMCPSACGLDVRVVDGRAVKLEGNSLHPVNQGVCCPKGQTSLEVIYSPERLKGPMTRRTRSAGWAPLSWDEALGLAAAKLRDLREHDLAHTVALLYSETHGQMRNIVQRLLAAYGSPNEIRMENPDTHAVRLATYLTQGINGLPVYQLEQTRYVISFGGSVLESSRHLLSNLSGAGFLRRGTTERGKLVVVDPRLSISAA
ncbi:MAG: molybdopterin-dependent oxidoreductase, partial [Chloroflexi bacterium]|nr:molybdopterin-dependent oxidoreductase [Chloroflexota bacterium]